MFKKNQINIGLAVGAFKMNRGEGRNEGGQRGYGMREGGFGGGMRGGGMRGGMGSGMRGGGMRSGGYSAETGLIGAKQSINWNSFIFE